MCKITSNQNSQLYSFPCCSNLIVCENKKNPTASKNCEKSFKKMSSFCWGHVKANWTPVGPMTPVWEGCLRPRLTPTEFLSSPALVHLCSALWSLTPSAPHRSDSQEDGPFTRAVWRCWAQTLTGHRAGVWSVERPGAPRRLLWPAGSWAWATLTRACK